MDFNKSVTKENVARAFAGECQDGARYQFIIDRCNYEGYNYVANTLKGLSKNEMAHADALYKMMLKYTNGTKNVEITAGYPFDIISLPDSILEAADVEKTESERVYPAFSKKAKEEGFNDIAKLFELIAKTEHCHYLLLKEVGTKMKNGKLYKLKNNKWKCSNCGHEETCDEAWKKCPLCNKEQGYVIFPIADEE